MEFAASSTPQQQPQQTPSQQAQPSPQQHNASLEHPDLALIIKEVDVLFPSIQYTRRTDYISKFQLFISNKWARSKDAPGNLLYLQRNVGQSQNPYIQFFILKTYGHVITPTNCIFPIPATENHRPICKPIIFYTNIYKEVLLWFLLRRPELCSIIDPQTQETILHQYNIDYSVLRFVYAQDKTLATLTDSFGRTPLHHKNQPFALVQAILTDFPHLANAMDSKGNIVAIVLGISQTSPTHAQQQQHLQQMAQSIQAHSTNPSLDGNASDDGETVSQNDEGNNRTAATSQGSHHHGHHNHHGAAAGHHNNHHGNNHHHGHRQMNHHGNHRQMNHRQSNGHHGNHHGHHHTAHHAHHAHGGSNTMMRHQSQNNTNPQQQQQQQQQNTPQTQQLQQQQQQFNLPQYAFPLHQIPQSQLNTDQTGAAL